jgi:hypothetical protein
LKLALQKEIDSLMKMKQRVVLLVLAAWPTLTGCGGGPSELDDSGFVPNNRQIIEDPSFANDIQTMFNREGCTNGACHGVGASAGLTLETGEAYASLVGVPSTQSGYERVTPEKPAESYLIIKLEGTQSEGARMPLGGSPLDEIDMGTLKNWITKGAKNN